jgi:4-amino-4-deoxy-L-arabinose transferase-like glycosyltransferase
LSAIEDLELPASRSHSRPVRLRALDRPTWRHWLAALAVLAGIPLRFWNLAGVPSSLNQDEAVYAYDAFSIFHTGRDHHGHPFPLAGLESFGPFSGAMLSFLEVPAVGILGLHVWVVRAVPALVSLITIPCVAGLGLLLFDSWLVGLTAAWVVALLPSMRSSGKVTARSSSRHWPAVWRWRPITR